MFRQEERTKLYLLNVIKGLAGDETNTSKKEETRKWLMTQLAPGSIEWRERLGWKQAVKGGGLTLPNSHSIQFKSWKGYLQLEGYGSSASLYLSWVFLVTDKRFISAVQCGLQKCLLMNCRRDFLSLLKTGGYLSLWKTKWRLIGSLILITFLGLHSWNRHISRAVF